MTKSIKVFMSVFALLVTVAFPVAASAGMAEFSYSEPAVIKDNFNSDKIDLNAYLGGEVKSFDAMPATKAAPALVATSKSVIQKRRLKTMLAVRSLSLGVPEAVPISA